MAKYLPLTSYLISTLIFLSSLENTCSQEFVTRLNRRQLGMMKKEKISHFKFYWHDIYSAPSPTVVPIIQPPPSSAATTGFGSVSMIDDPITMGPDLKTSKLVGRAQGLYGVASQKEVALLMVMNFWFVEGKYNGSSITIMGRNPVFNKVREMPIIGGSGLFRFARGYAHASTHNFNLTSGDACVEYNLYVLHY